MSGRATHGSASTSARQARDLPITAYGAPASTIDHNAIGFNGSSRSATGNGPVRPIDQLLKLDITLEEENRLPRSERNLLRDYRQEHNIPRNAPLAHALRTRAAEQQQAAALAAAANATVISSGRKSGPAAAVAALASGVRAGKTPDLRKTGRSTAAATLDHHLAAADASGQPKGELVPNANGSGAQRRDPFAGITPLRSGTNTNVLNAGIAAGSALRHPRQHTTTSSASSARSNATSAGGGGLPAPGQPLPFGSRESQHVYGVALRAPLHSRSSTSEAGSDGKRHATAAAAAAAGADGIIIPDSGSSSVGTLSPTPRTRRRSLRPAGDMMDDDDEEDSESASEGQKHTRRPTPRKQRARGATELNLPAIDTPRAGLRARPSKGKERLLDADGERAAGVGLGEEEEDGDAAADLTVRNGAAPSAIRTSRRSARPAARQRAGSPFAAAAAAALPRTRRGLSVCSILSLVLLWIILSLVKDLLFQTYDPWVTARTAGRKVGVPERMLSCLPAYSSWTCNRHGSGALPGSDHLKQQTKDSTGAAPITLPSDLVRTAAFDTLSKKFERLSSSHRKDKNALDKALRELVERFDLGANDVEQLLNQLKLVSDRVGSVEKQVKDVAKLASAGGGSAAAAAAAAAAQFGGKKAGDFVTVGELRRYHADRTGREDLANPLAGARLIPDLTTWTSWWGGTYGVRPRSSGGWKSRFASSREFARQASDIHSHNPAWALEPIVRAGHCWQFPGSMEGTLGIGLGRPAAVDAFSVEHIQRELVPGRQSAPKEVELWGVVDSSNATAVEVLEHWRAEMEAERNQARKEATGSGPHSNNWEWEAWLAEGADQPQPTPPGPNFVLMGSLVYNIEGPELQMGEVRRSVRRLMGEEFGVAMDTVQLRFRGNHGAENTCVYRVRVHPALAG